MFVEVLYMELHTFSFELSTTLCVCGIRTTWWSNCRVGSHTRAGKFRFNIANSAIKREPEKYTHIYIIKHQHINSLIKLSIFIFKTHHQTYSWVTCIISCLWSELLNTHCYIILVCYRLCQYIELSKAFIMCCYISRISSFTI